MTVRFVRHYQHYEAGSVETLPESTEEALILQRFAVRATNDPGPPKSGCAFIAAGRSSVVVLNPQVSPASVVTARITQATPDRTMTRIERVEPAPGSFTIRGNSETSSDVTVTWSVK